MARLRSETPGPVVCGWAGVATLFHSLADIDFVAMSVEREELARLVQEIPDEQVPEVLAEVRRRLRPVAERCWPPAWFGIDPGDGSAVGARSEELLAEGFGR